MLVAVVESGVYLDVNKHFHDEQDAKLTSKTLPSDLNAGSLREFEAGRSR